VNPNHYSDRSCEIQTYPGAIRFQLKKQEPNRFLIPHQVLMALDSWQLRELEDLVIYEASRYDLNVVTYQDHQQWGMIVELSRPRKGPE
jgi:hypothetical protein